MQENIENNSENNEKDPISEVLNNAVNEEEQNQAENTENLSENDSQQTQIADLKMQLAEQKDKYLRLFADFDNHKKRSAREKVELIETAAKDTIKNLLPVLDDFDRAMHSMETATDIDSVKNGVQLIYHKMNNILAAQGLKAMETKGKDFNTEQHEAITEIPVTTPELSGKVIDEVEKGYTLNEKIIRYAKVVVGK